MIVFVSMGKTFDVDAAQERAASHRAEMAGNYYRHYLGGLYYVSDVVVDEGTGELRVEYRSMDKKTESGAPFKWSRLLYLNFLDVLVDGQPRYTKVASDGNVHDP